MFRMICGRGFIRMISYPQFSCFVVVSMAGEWGACMDHRREGLDQTVFRRTSISTNSRIRCCATRFAFPVYAKLTVFED